MTNEVFNGRRFGAWFKYDLKQMWRNQMKAALGIGLSGLILYAIVISYNLIINQVWNAPSIEARAIVFTFAVIALTLYQAKTYGFLTDKSKGSAWLMAPGSTLEKWTAMIINTLIVIPVLFCVAFIGVDWLLCTIDHSMGESLITIFTDGVSKYNEVLATGEVEIMIGAGSLVWISIVTMFSNFLYFLLCGICFKKHKIIWALAIMFVVSMVFSLIGNTAIDLEEFSRDMLAGKTPNEFINRLAIVSTVITVGLAGGIYYRLKTIKH